MAEIIAQGLTLSDSQSKTRPDTKIFYYMDGNAGLNNIQTYNRNKVVKSLKFAEHQESDEHFIRPCSDNKKPDSGELKTVAPLRDYENISEPIAGFISAGFDVDRQTGNTKIKSFTVTGNEPQNRAPNTIHSIRKSVPTAFPETRRLTENDPPKPEKWSDRLVSAGHVRGYLGGWTSTELPKRHVLSSVFPQPKRIQSAPMNKREELANSYVYTSTAQSAMNEVPFDASLQPKMWPPVSTLEPCADPVSRKPFISKFNPPSQTWRRQDGQFDREQIRADFYNPQRPHDFVTPAKRSEQIPGYSGCIGENTPQELDNPNFNPFKPYTVCRTTIPKFSYASTSPHIPGYTGCMPHVFKNITERHQQALVSTYTDDFKRTGQFSKIMTTVKPNNPFKAS